MARLLYLSATILLMLAAISQLVSQDRMTFARDDAETASLRDQVVRNQTEIRLLKGLLGKSEDVRDRVIRLEAGQERLAAELKELREQMDRQNWLLLTIAMGILAFLAKEFFGVFQLSRKRESIR